MRCGWSPSNPIGNANFLFVVIRGIDYFFFDGHKIGCKYMVMVKVFVNAVKMLFMLNLLFCGIVKC